MNMSQNCIRSNAKHPDFISLVKQLDKELAERDGKDHAFYTQFNSIENIDHTVLIYNGDKAVGCGAMKPFNDNSMEIKRMFTTPEARGQGIATRILSELENWAKTLQYQKCVLETGKRQPEAIVLYKRNGYKSIPNYGQYAKVENSLCFEKKLL
ncbi:MAG: GNAT family N-acetyltransferase [Flavobacteriaceae bacterium]|nr:GNAT family N-acetyltransferase [Flavobacteriaceae bacterium]